MAAAPFKAWVYLSGKAIGELPVPPECLIGRSSAEGMEVYVVVGAPDHPMAAGSAHLSFDHGFPPRESEL